MNWASKLGADGKVSLFTPSMCHCLGEERDLWSPDFGYYPKLFGNIRDRVVRFFKCTAMVSILRLSLLYFYSPLTTFVYRNRITGPMKQTVFFWISPKRVTKTTSTLLSFNICLPRYAVFQSQSIITNIVLNLF